jgi:hypothetical protein
MRIKRNLIQICLPGAVACLNSLRRAAEPMPIFRPPRKINQGHQFMNTSFLQTFRAPLLLLLCALWMPWKASAAGYWTPLANPAPGGVGEMMLMPDGSVLAASRVTDLTENPRSSGSRLVVSPDA